MRRISQKDAEALVGQIVELMEVQINFSAASAVVDEFELNWEKRRTVDAICSLSAKYGEDND